MVIGAIVAILPVIPVLRFTQHQSDLPTDMVREKEAAVEQQCRGTL